jgi:hypothetical protein
MIVKTLKANGISSPDGLDDYDGYLCELANAIHKQNVTKGFDFTQADFAEKLALVHAEISEALECLRDRHMNFDEIYFTENGKPEGFYVELADAMIRILHMFGKFDVDPAAIIGLKMKFNATRPHMHGRNF